MARSALTPERFLDELTSGFQRLAPAEASVLLAVSGGADSTALLIATDELIRSGAVRLRIEVASVDHGLRSESCEELRFVEALAAQRGLPFHPLPLGLSAGAGIEARARHARYAALEDIRITRKLDLIATAHTLEDQAETLLMRLMRGSALRGAVAIHARRGTVIRPMLRTRRELVRAFLSQRGQPFRDDPMNADRRFLRVRVRHELLPLLTSLGGDDVAERIAHFAELARDDEQGWNDAARGALARCRLPNGFDAVAMRALATPIRRRVLARLLSEHQVPVSRRMIADAQRALEESTELELRRGVMVSATGGLFRVIEAARAADSPLALSAETEGLHAPSQLRFRLGRRREAGSLGVRDVDLPLTIRARLPGDRVLLGNQHRRLQDVLIDARIPRERRARLAVVTDAAGNILWVPGVWPRHLPRDGEWFLIATPSGQSQSPL